MDDNFNEYKNTKGTHIIKYSMSTSSFSLLLLQQVFPNDTSYCINNNNSPVLLKLGYSQNIITFNMEVKVFLIRFPKTFRISAWWQFSSIAKVVKIVIGDLLHYFPFYSILIAAFQSFPLFQSNRSEKAYHIFSWGWYVNP